MSWSWQFTSGHITPNHPHKVAGARLETSQISKALLYQHADQNTFEPVSFGWSKENDHVIIVRRAY